MGTPKDPVVAIVVGKVKSGKTVDAIYSFPKAVFVAAPGALKGSEAVVGYEIPANRQIDLEQIGDVTAALPKIAKVSSVVVVDDFTIIAQRTITRLEKRLKGWDVWDAARDLLLDLRTAARRAGVHVWFTCHEKSPRMGKNGLVLGGPDLPGQMPEGFPAVADIVARVKWEPTRVGPWPYIYSCGPDPEWALGDRHDLIGQASPMNARELLLAAGYDPATLPRAAGMEWAEGAVEKLASMIAGQPEAEQRTIMINAGRKLVAAGKPAMHARWVLRDAADRAVIRGRKAGTNLIDSFFRESDGLGGMVSPVAPAPVENPTPVAPPAAVAE